MPRYIDAHRAENLLIMCGTYHGVISFDTVIHVLHDTQTADVVERKKGEWIYVTNGRGGHECSMCHMYAPSFNSGAENLSPYCPNCGAEMEKGETDDN